MRAAGAQDLSPQIDVLDMVALVLAASRLIGGLANLPLFKNANVSLTQWLALSVFSTKDGVSNKMLARSLGVSRQRANQLCTSLSEAKLIVIAHAEDDSRRNVITITDTGKKQLGSLNLQMLDLVSRALGGRSQSLTRAGKQMRLMMEIVHAGTPEMAAKLSKRRERRMARKVGTSDAPGSNI